MSLIGSILSGGVSSILDTVSKTIDDLHTSDEEKSQAKLALLQVQVQAAQVQAQMEAELEKAVMADMANLREQVKVELQSADPWVRRARPAFFWIMYGVIAVNFLLPAIVGYFGRSVIKIEIPQDLWYVWGTAYLGYAYLRTQEKVNDPRLKSGASAREGL